MDIVLNNYAVVDETGYIIRFQDDQLSVPGEIVLPVVADSLPIISLNERMGSPEYSVLPDKVLATFTVRVLNPEELAAQPKLSFAQLMIGLVAEGWLSEAECLAWMAGTLPAPVLGVISQLPEAMQFPAKAKALRPFEVLRNDPLVETLGAYQGKTPAQLDSFFATYGAY